MPAENKPRGSFKVFLPSFLIFLLAFLSIMGWKTIAFSQEKSHSAAQATNNFISEYNPENAFHPSEDVMKEVDEALEKAAQQGKRTLIVMGGNWCHDSQGLIRHFTDPQMDAILKENYQTLIVDVGYLDKAAEITQRFGQPIYYSTPTVLIIDPVSERLVNEHNMHQWRNADNIKLEHTRQYFLEMATSIVPPAEAPPSPRLKDLLDEIKSYEQTQVERIYKAFKVIGPMLAIDKDKRPKNFMPYWMELRQLRYGLPDEMAKLRQQAKQRILKGEKNIKLTFPVYPSFSWE